MVQQQSSLRIILVVAILFGIAGCSSGGKLRSDFDHTADFSVYNSWNFIENAGPDYEGYESLFTGYMITAITLEMEKRDYVMSDNPDLLVNFNVFIQDKTKITTSPSTMGAYPHGSYYGYRGSRYGSWGGYGYGTETHVSQYTEGTFNIDLIDAEKHQLVWEAVGVGRITDKLRNNLEKAVREGVPNFFAMYPFVAGSGEAVELK